MNKIKEIINRIIEKFKKIDFKDKKVYIPLIIIGIILLILLLILLSNLSKDEKFYSTAKEVKFIDKLVDDPNRKEINVPVFIEEDISNCVGDVCVTNVKVTCYEKRGLIEFTVENTSSSTISGGYLNLVIGKYSAVIWYDSIEPGGSYEGFHTYDGTEDDSDKILSEDGGNSKEGNKSIYDLRDAESTGYYVKEIDDNDKSAITNYKYYSCLASRNYYELDFDGNRIYKSGDEDYIQTSCIYRSDNNREIHVIEHFSDPCKASNSSTGVTVINQCGFASNCVETSSGKCEFVEGGTGGDIDSNNCVKYTVTEEIVRDGEKQNVTKDYCGKRDSNGYIVPDSSSTITGKIKCDSYALCIDDTCYPFCEDLENSN